MTSEPLKIILPKLGESILHATVIQWFKKVGDLVELDEPLLEVSTDKVNSEIPSPYAGRIEAILVAAGQEAEVGQCLATLIGGEGAIESKKAEKQKDQSAFYSPAVTRLVQERGLSEQEVCRIARTGAGGRLTKSDVEKHAPSASEYERVPMSALRKAIADNMARSFYEAPHASVMTEIDVTRLVKVIREKKEEFHAQHGVKLTITPFVAQAICRALQAFPLLNASLEADTIIMKRFVNLGIAVSVQDGVMVPVLRDCHRLSFPDIAIQLADLAHRARHRELSPGEVQEGSSALSSLPIKQQAVEAIALYNS